MSHDTHFLSRLSRVSDEHVALALSLYRDPGMVKELLARARLPDGAARVLRGRSKRARIPAPMHGPGKVR